MRGERRDRGAVSVVVAISIVMLMGCVALAVDTGSIYSDRQMLQNGADAGALAIAQSCLKGPCIDSANKYAQANKIDGNANGGIIDKTTGSPKVVKQTDGSVTVEVVSSHDNWFAAIIGVPTTKIKARATATWGYGTATQPFTFPKCSFDDATGGWDHGKPKLNAAVVIYVGSHGNTCKNGQVVEYPPGGKGWLETIEDTCEAPSPDTNLILATDPGNDGPNACKNFDWKTRLNTAVLVPIFGDTKGNGKGGQYVIIGLAAFKITGYCLPTGNKDVNFDGKCDGNTRGLKGVFTDYSAFSDFTVDPNTHVITRAVKLTE